MKMLWQRLTLWEIPRVATAIVGTAVVGAATTAYSASKAAEAQNEASERANAGLEARYQQTRSDLSPFREIGVEGANKLMGRLDQLTSPIVMDQAALEQTPGYQFARTQGLKSVQNSAAARGLGASGAALKGAANFATGLADQTYQTQFGLENTNRTNAYNRLMGVAQLGQNAAAQTGAYGTQTSLAQSGNTIGAGNATGAAWMAGAGGVNNALGSIPGAMHYNNVFGGLYG